MTEDLAVIAPRLQTVSLLLEQRLQQPVLSSKMLQDLGRLRLGQIMVESIAWTPQLIVHADMERKRFGFKHFNNASELNKEINPFGVFFSPHFAFAVFIFRNLHWLKIIS